MRFNLEQYKSIVLVENEKLKSVQRTSGGDVLRGSHSDLYLGVGLS